MKTLYESSLLSLDSSDGFKHMKLNAQMVEARDTDVDWSVHTYTLHGGLQEGVEVVEIYNGTLGFAVLPTRGMGIWKGQCGEVTLEWGSPVKTPVHPAYVNLQDRGGIGWLKGFSEWFVRCGMGHFGPPGIDVIRDDAGNVIGEVPLTLHGNIANIPAHDVSLEITDQEIVLRGEVDETMLFGTTLRLNTEIRTTFGSSKLTIVDKVTNVGGVPQEHQMLYHVNYGGTLLEKGSRFVAPVAQVAPRDARAAEGIDSLFEYGAPENGFAEQAYFFKLLGSGEDQQTLAMLKNAAGDQASVVRFSLKQLPCFTLWKNTAARQDGYVTGLEPGTGFPNLRTFEREKGRVIRLASGASHTMCLTLEAIAGRDVVDATQQEIEQVQQQAAPVIANQPVPELCDL